jgi:hypothetical protein
MNWLGLFLLILVVVIAWQLWEASYAGGYLGGAKSDDDDEKKDSKKSTESKFSYKEFQSYTITEDGHFVRASYNANDGDNSILVLYNNGSRDKDGKITQGDVQIAFKIEAGKLDKEGVKLEGIDKIDKRGKEIITKALMSLKARFDDSTAKAIKGVLEWIEL